MTTAVDSVKASEPIDAREMLEESAQEYGSDVILNRAIPALEDGLKPVQRKAVWQMYLMKLFSTSKPKVLAIVSGATMVWHPHGDGSIETALTNMYRPWLNRAPFVEIIGNAGSTDNEPAAARYIKTRMTRVADLITQDLAKDCVDMMPNFDNTEEEPVQLPARVPVALINGAFGIAWGMGTNIAPHNPIELLDAAIALANDPETPTKDLLSIMPGPDFASGCELVDDGSCAADEWNTGNARFTIRGKIREIEHVDFKDQRVLEIYQIPPKVKIESIVEQSEKILVRYASHLKLNEISDASGDDVSILISFDKGVTDEQIEQAKSLIVSKTDMETRWSVNNNLVHRGRVKAFSNREYLNAFLDYRRETLRKIYGTERKRMSDDLELTNAAIFLVEHPEEVTEVVSPASSREEIKDALSAKFDLTERQSDYIAGQPIYRMSKGDLKRVKSLHEKRDELESGIKRRDTLLSDNTEFEKSLIEDLHSSIEFLGRDNFPRLTSIISPKKAKSKVKAVKLDETATVESKPVTVVVRSDLSALRIGRKAFSNQHAENESSIVDSVDVTTDEYVILVTRKGRGVIRLVNDLQHANLADNLEPLNRSIESLDSDDDFIGIVPVRENSMFMTLSRMGYVKSMSSQKVCPSTNTRTYVKKTYPISGVKKGEDDLTHLIRLESDESLPGEMNYDTLDSKDKERHETLNLDKWLSRDDSGTSSGAKGLKLGDGSRSITSFELA